MAKIIHTEDNEKFGRTVVVYFNCETQEYICKLFLLNKYYEPADYFTDSYDDAIDTAAEMVKEPTW